MPTRETLIALRERVLKAIRRMPSATAAVVGSFAPFILGSLAIVVPVSTKGHAAQEGIGLVMGFVFLGIALAESASRGRDRGRAERVTNTTIKLSLAPGTVLVSEEADHG